MVLLELPAPSTWQPPQSCGPTQNSLMIALTSGRSDGPSSCTAYPAGGWQRTYPDGQVDLLDVQGDLLVLAAAESSDGLIDPAVEREMLTSLRPATPQQMADLPAD
jgi:hypothetical protein